MSAAELALPHRLKRSVFEHGAITAPEVRQRVERILAPKVEHPFSRRPLGWKTYDEVLEEFRDADHPLKDFVDTGLR